MLRFLCVISVGICLVLPSQSQSLNGDSGGILENSSFQAPDEFHPNINPSLTLTRASGNIRIDGHLNEDAWNEVLPVHNFSEFFPNDMTRPPIELIGMMTYDQDNLYVGIIVADNPSTLRANISDRDEIWQDDHAGVVLDPNRDGQGMYLIVANPLGIQADSFISPNNDDDGFNILFRSAGQITENGYQIEMAIPFKSLRFPNVDSHIWGATFMITRPRDSRSQYSWAAISQDDPCRSCQLGEINGIRGIRTGRNLEILPSLTGGAVGALRDDELPSAGFKNERMTVEPSLNLKYGITSEVTADITVNPDFSQIESDEAQIDVNSTFALSFAERRPFFQEGSGLFNTKIQTVYKRSDWSCQVDGAIWICGCGIHWGPRSSFSSFIAF